MALPYNERFLLEQRRINEYPQPEGYVYPQENYKQVIDYVAVEISVTGNGKTITSLGTSDKLTAGQKNILNTADLGNDISIKIKFKYKDQAADNLGRRDTMIEGETLVKVVPQTEAEYPGGYEQLSDYFAENVINKIAEPSASGKIHMAIVKFTVNEKGHIVDAKISRTTTDANLDKLLLEALNKMPKWKPAENSEGIKVKQEFIIPFGGDGC